MTKNQKKRKKPVEKAVQMYQPKDFLDLIAPAAVKFNTDSYVLGGLYRCVLALRGYPAVTEELALFSHICNRAGVTLHLYARQVTAAEEDAIYHKAVNKNRLDRSNQDNLKRSVTAEANLQDVAAIIAGARKNREPLIHCAVFLELGAVIGVRLDFLQLIGWFVLALYIINELTSILENMVALGVDVPEFLIRGLAAVKTAVDEAGDRVIPPEEKPAEDTEKKEE